MLWAAMTDRDEVASATVTATPRGTKPNTSPQLRGRQDIALGTRSTN